MRLAALYDIHGNLPALEAVLEEVRRAGVDHIVVGGDVLPGPMPRETLELLLEIDIPARFITGNGELAVLAQIDAGDRQPVTYWGTRGGQPLPKPLQEVVRWCGRQLQPAQEQAIRSWPATLWLEHPQMGRILFCHGTPQSETAGFTRLTSEDCLRPVFEGLSGHLVVCGHTHMPFDRMVAGARVVNAGSLGMPFGQPGADWLLLTDDVHLRHTFYDLEDAATRVRATPYPQADEFAMGSILRPPSEDAMLQTFTNISFR